MVSTQDTRFPPRRPWETDVSTQPGEPSCSAWCRRCTAEHRLPAGNAAQQALVLRDYLRQTGSLSLPGQRTLPDSLVSTECLFGEGRGKMFGVLEGRLSDGSSCWLYAFSGQYNGRWLIPGWAPPLFDPVIFDAINTPTERYISDLSRQIATLPDRSSGIYLTLFEQRRDASRRLTRCLQNLYRVTNFRGEHVSLAAACGRQSGLPTGTGDCCAPKLLNQAAVLGLTPLSLAEFFFGRDNRSARRQHGRFYPPCEDKCGPLLGFMLCGSDTRI